jgi:hypothetical protein
VFAGSADNVSLDLETTLRRLKATLAGVLAQIRVIYPDFPPRFLPAGGDF